MTPEDRERRSRSIEARIHSLLALAGDSLKEYERRDVRHFTDVNEFGLALQTFADIYREAGREIPLAAREASTALAVQMGIDPAEMYAGTNKKF
jgi:hypothetical protein